MFERAIPLNQDGSAAKHIQAYIERSFREDMEGNVWNSSPEVARQIEQSLIFTKVEGIFPEFPEERLRNIQSVADLGCGPGEWASQVANLYSHMNVVGVDNSDFMLEHGRRHAAMLGLDNLNFLKSDIRKSNFQANSFDLVNARFLQTAFFLEDWPLFAKECVRLAKPGGYIRLNELAWSESNSPNLNKLVGLMNKAFFILKKSFTPESMGIALALPNLLRAQGCNTFLYPFGVDYSYGAPLGEHIRDHLMKTMGPELGLGALFTSLNLMSVNEYQHVYDSAMAEVTNDDFWALGTMYIVIGRKKA